LPAGWNEEGRGDPLSHWLETAAKEQLEDALAAIRKIGDAQYKIPGIPQPINLRAATDEEIFALLLSNDCDSHLYVDHFLPRLKEQWPEVCLAAVRETCALAHVREQTFEICLAAIKQSITCRQEDRILKLIKDPQIKERIKKMIPQFKEERRQFDLQEAGHRERTWER
jgi:hypothetical protein